MCSNTKGYIYIYIYVNLHFHLVKEAYPSKTSVLRFRGGYHGLPSWIGLNCHHILTGIILHRISITRFHVMFRRAV